MTYERVLVLLPPSILTRAQADTFKGNIWENLEHLMRHHYVREGTEAPSSRQELDWEPWYCDEAVADWVGDYLSWDSPDITQVSPKRRRRVLRSGAACPIMAF